MAAGVAEWGGIIGAAWVLEGATYGGSRCFVIADGSGAAGGSELPGSEGEICSVEGAFWFAVGAWSWGACDAVHGVASGVQCSSVALERTDGYSGWGTNCESYAPRDRGA